MSSPKPPENFKINRSTPRSLMYFQNTSTHEDPLKFLLANKHKSDSLPFPPPHLMEYSESVDDHEKSGARLARILRTTLEENQIELTSLKNVLDFGCSNGRVLRHFEDMATVNSYWGCDINSNTILWNLGNLLPPFNFFVNSTNPNLPFRDGTFNLIYAMSVFTHMDDMFFTWLLEVRRCIRQDGYAFLTFLDENSVRYGLEYPNRPVGRQIAANPELIDGLMTGKYNMVAINRDSASMTYVRRDFLRDYLIRFFEVVAVVENTMARHQTGFLLKNNKLN